MDACVIVLIISENKEPIVLGKNLPKPVGIHPAHVKSDESAAYKRNYKGQLSPRRNP